MKKTLLALAVSAFAVNAFAAPVDYTAPNPGVNTIANELAVPSTNLITTSVADTLTWDLGFSVTAATQRYIKITLTGGAAFDTTVAPSLEVNGAAAAVSQFSANRDSVIFEVSPAATVEPTADVVLTPGNLKITGKNSIGASYQLFETAVDAVNATNPLVSKPAAPYINFSNGLTTSVKAFDVQRIIDVSAAPVSASKFIGPVTSAVIGEVAIDVVPGLVSYTLATPVTLASLVTNGTLVVNGDFSAGLKTNGVLQAGTVTLDADGIGAGTAAVASSIDATSATFTLGTNQVGDIVAAPGANVYGQLVYTVNGNEAIAPSSFTASYNVTPVTGTSTANATLGKIGELAKNGSTQYVDLALKPGGAYENFVRISNKTNVAGNVYITVIADNGAQQTISLSDIAGQSASLAARSSTTQISVKQIFDAAAAKGLVLAGEGKLRLLVDGEFPASGDTYNANDYGLSVQTFTVSKDGNSFSTF